MDSPGGSSMSSLGASEATKLLKEMLKMGGLGNPGLGKSRSESSDTSTASLASHVKAALENSGSSQSIDKVEIDQDSTHENGNATFEEMFLPGAEPVSGKQTIHLQGTDTSNSFMITGRQVEIIESEASGSAQATSGSNKVKINPVVKFEWEHRYYTGNMVAVHTDCVHVAYVLKGKSGGIVRIINRKTAQRTLLKGFTGKVQDIAFAQLSSLLLGCVDEVGDMFINEIHETSDGSITTTLLLNVTRPKGSPPCTNHRLIWCPYIGDADDSSAANTTNTTDSLSTCDYNKMLVLTHDNTVDIWNVDMVTKEHGSGPMSSTDVITGLLRIDQGGHKAEQYAAEDFQWSLLGLMLIKQLVSWQKKEDVPKPITSAAFSPDGTAIATAALDGQVKFYQVYFSDNTPPRCLHQWTPHEGKPLSSLFFLDDHKHPNPNATFWKFAVTGADSNREIKVWGCESWVCLQQINIVSPPDDLPSNFHMEPCLKASLDLSANYLVLSDIKRKVLLVFELSQDDKSACVSAVSEFLLTQPCLSFSILDAGRRRTHKDADEEDNPIADMTTGEVDVAEDEEVSRDTIGPDIEVAMNMYSVHTKAFQHLQIRYKVDWMSSRPPPLTTSFVSQDTAGFIDPLSDMSIETEPSERDGAEIHASALTQGLEQSIVTLPEPNAPPAPLLMTPDAFSSPSPKKPESLVYMPDAVGQSSMSTLSSLTHVTTMDDDHPQTLTTGQDSAASSVTITPASSLDLTAGLPLGTPSSVPLPPPTPGEDASNPSSRRVSEVEPASPSSFRSQPPEFIKDTLSHLPSPPHSEGSFPTLPTLNKDFFTSSPMSELRFKPAVTSSDQASDDVDKMFSTDSSSVHRQRAKLQSNGSSSSTSLEVSEILDGMKRSDPEEFLGEEEEDEEREERDEGEEGGVKQGPDTERAQGDVAKLPTKPHYDLKAWPKPPDVADVNRDSERMTVDALMNAGLSPQQQGEMVSTSPPVQQQEDDVQIEEDEEEESEPTEVPSQSKDDQATSQGQTAPRTDPAQLAPADSSLTHELQTCVRQMLELLQTQHREIINLRRDLTEQQRLSTAVSDLQTDVRSLQTNLSSQVAGALRDHAQAESHRLQKVLDTCDSQQRQKHDRLVSSVTATLDRSVGSHLEHLVKEEFSRTVVPNVTRVLEPIKDQLHLTMAQRLTATDSLMKENIGKLVRSRQTMEVLAQAAGSAIQMPVQAACRDVLVPGFDRACQNIFHQVNQTFQRGTQEYMQNLERHLEHVRRQHAEARDPVVGQLQSMVVAFEGREEAYKPLCAQLQQVSETMRSSAQQIQVSNRRLETGVQEAMKRMQDNLSSQLRSIIQAELTTALHDQQTSLGDHLVNAIRSGAVTPIVTSVSPDPQQILQLLRQGQLNSAFQQALSASDLGLVMYVCETVNPSQVFNQTPCPLQQPVLLSLIQQLSADLTSNMDLKYKYLEEAIMNLDTGNLVTKEHMPAVLGQLSQNLSAYIHANPTDAMTRNMRILQMAAQSLIK